MRARAPRLKSDHRIADRNDTSARPDRAAPRTAMKLRLKSRLRLLTLGARYLSIQGYLGIDGWLTVDEAVTLYDLARAVPAGGHVVEIGSWQGKSAVVLGKGLAASAGSRLHCVDPFNADGCPPSLPLFAERRARLDCSLREGFERNLRRHGVADRVEVWQGYSQDVAARFPHAIDLLFIDGNHEYEAVRQDFELWTSKLRPGGVVCLHDACDKFPGVERLIAESIADDTGFAGHRRVDSLYVARRQGEPALV